MPGTEKPVHEGSSLLSLVDLNMAWDFCLLVRLLCPNSHSHAPDLVEARCRLGDGPSVWPTRSAVSTSRHSISVGRVGGGGGLLHRRCRVGKVGGACVSFLLTCGVPSPEPPSWAGTANMGRNSDCQLEAGLLPPHSGRGLKGTDLGALFCVTLREGPGILGGSAYV